MTGQPMAMANGVVDLLAADKNKMLLNNMINRLEAKHLFEEETDGLHIIINCPIWKPGVVFSF